MKRPNVLVLYTDQQRWDTIRAGGHEHLHTPNLDALAARGTLFDKVFCNSPVCMPSRASMLSGQYPSSMGTTCNGIEFPEDIQCIHTYLKPYGYHTANIGKLHFRNHASHQRDHRDPNPSYGFDTHIISDEPGCYDDAYIKWVEMRDPQAVEHCRCDTPPAWRGKPVRVHDRSGFAPYVFKGPEDLTHTAFVADETIQYLRQQKDRPFFCVSGFYAPHCPINPPQRFVEMYDAESLPLPYFNPGENRGDVPDEHWRKIKAYYYALISHVDDQVGRILSELKALGLEENTLVIFTSDHGEHLGDHGQMGKSQPWDSSARVPLIVSYPKAFNPQPMKSPMIEHVDLAPTILDCCGVQVPDVMQGRSFRPLLTGEPYKERTSAFMEIRKPAGPGFKAIRTHRYLYSVNEKAAEQLYDLEADPHQLNNLAKESSYAESLKEMRGTLIGRWFEVDRTGPRETGPY